MFKKEIKEWKLNGYHNYVPVAERSMETNTELKGVIPELDAHTPSSVYDTLLENNLILDPNIECNSRLSEWVASRFWVYKTTVSMQKIDKNKKYRLVFEGLDYKCEIWFNGKKVASSENMYVPVFVDVTEFIQTENTIKILFYNAIDEMGQLGYTSKVLSQKARFSYKWDFCPRLPLIGIYRPVYLEEYTIDASDFLLKTTMDGDFSFSCKLSGNEKELNCSVDIFDKDKIIYSSVKKGKIDSFEVKDKLDNVKLWECNTRGEPYLYTLIFTVKDKDEVAYKSLLILVSRP